MIYSNLKNQITLLIVIFMSVNLSGQNWDRFPIMQGLSFTRDLKAVDFDNDGDEDVLALTDAYIVWFENLDGEGKFAHQKYIGTTFSNTIFPADVDNDGDIDIVNIGGFLENTGNGQFTAINLGYSNIHTVMDVADYTGDGFVDIVVRAGTNLELYTNLQNNTFTNDAPYFENITGTYSLVDIDFDGDIDMIQGTDTELTIQLNEGGSSFTTIPVHDSGAAHPKYGDFDADGDLDLVFKLVSNGHAYTCENLGNNQWDSPSLLSTEMFGNHFEIADMNNDNNLDIVFDLGNGKIGCFKYDMGTFTLQEITHPIANLGYFKTITLDVDGDNQLDVIGYHSSPVLGYPRIGWYQNLDSNFSENKPVSMSVMDGLLSMTTADLDNDGDQDFILDNKGLRWLENVGNGVFCPGATLTRKSLNRKVFTFDWDEDGDQDIFGAISSSDLGIWQNDGNANFTPLDLHPLPSGAGYISGDFGDIDNDGDLDLLVAVDGSPYFKVLWYENINNTSLTEHFVSNSGFEFVELSDTDQDGDLDIVGLDRDSELIAVAKNLNNGDFSAPEIVVENIINKVNSFYVVDLNGDNQEDFLMSNSPFSGASTIKMYLNAGDSWPIDDNIASFSGAGVTTFTHCNVTDIDLDGDLDVLYGTSKENKCGVYRNNGNGDFNFLTTILTASGATAIANMHAADMDGDQFPDPISYYYVEGFGGPFEDDEIDEINWHNNIFDGTTPPDFSTAVSDIICNDNSTNDITTDDFIQFNLTINTPTLSGDYILEAAGASVATISPSVGTYGINETFTLSSGTAGNGDIVFLVTDNNDQYLSTSFNVVDPGNCSVPVNLSPVPNAKQFQLSPNPFTNQIHIETSSINAQDKFQIKLISTTGVEIFSEIIQNNGVQFISTGDFPTGIYYYKIINLKNNQLAKSDRLLKM